MTAQKNPTDSTTRNVKASAKRDAAMATDIKELKRQVKELQGIVEKLCGGDGVSVGLDWTKGWEVSNRDR